MSSALLQSPVHLPPAAALQLSQQAPAILKSAPPSSSPFPLATLASSAETADLWTTYENLLLSCLRTGDEDSAHLCLERLTERFGADNERVMAFKGLFQEAIAENNAALQKVLEEYEEILANNASNMPVAKRRISLLKSLQKIPEAITALNQFLDASPTDAEAWAELGDLYISQGMYAQGIFAWEEVLLITPNGWNIHARLGEVLFMAASASNSDANGDKYLADSMRRFCRSVELCDDYLRGYYGLKLVSHSPMSIACCGRNTAQVTSRLLTRLPQSSRSSKTEDGPALPDLKTVERLNEMATAKLAEIVRRSTGGEPGWTGYEESEVAAAQELLKKDEAPNTR
ncbi:hypothetical protein F5884DRAFT_859245 [Xylogone sp. PMI_703]|nr:hypothetical protein F5884DRAFT_859245 [Xylogone sp. PMI_703]